VPDGGLTKLKEVNRVDVELNPFKTKQPASCPEVDCKKDLESGADTLCPNPKNDVSKNNTTINFLILFNN